MKKQIVCFLALALLLGGCGTEAVVATAPSLLEPAQISMGTTRVTRGEILDIAAYDAYLTPYIEVLTFSRDGKMGETFVNVGDTVEPGTLLATMDIQTVQDKIESLEQQLEDIRKRGQFSDRIAKANIKIAEAELAILEEEGATAEACAVKKAEIAQLQAQLEQAQELRSLDRKPLQQQVEALEAELAGSDIAAPFRGTVVYVTGKALGASIDQETPAIVLVDNSRLQVVCEQELDGDLISQAYRVYTKVGTEEYDLTWIPDEEETTGTVIEAPSDEDAEAADDAGLNVGGNTRFLLDAQLENLESGMYLPVVMVRVYRDNVLHIPKNALFSDAVGWYVYRVEDGVRVRQEVQVGLMTELDVEILSGLEEGDEIYVE